jgi:molybdopterin/thiamine biosynthesis adenylyltransferase
MLQALNPQVKLETIAENASEQNVAALVERCDIVISAAPLFTERLLMNREAVRQRKPLVDCAMYDLEGRLTTVIPGQTPCLACLYPEPPPNWKREFPVISPIASTVGCLAAMEAIKVITGLGEPLAGKLLTFDLRDMTFRTIAISRKPDCAVCGM